MGSKLYHLAWELLFIAFHFLELLLPSRVYMWLASRTLVRLWMWDFARLWEQQEIRRGREIRGNHTG